jgi:hypothetical protein
LFVKLLENTHPIGGWVLFAGSMVSFTIYRRRSLKETQETGMEEDPNNTFKETVET